MKKIVMVAAMLFAAISGAQAKDFALNNVDKNVSLSTCITATHIVALEYGTTVEVVRKLPGMQVSRIEIPSGTVVVICDGDSKTMTMAAYN